MCLRHVINLVVAKVHASRGDFMQFGLPNMRAIFIHKSNNNFVTPTICFTQSRRKLEPTRTPAYDDDFVWILIHLLAPFKMI
jgi:hypothetical protein